MVRLLRLTTRCSSTMAAGTSLRSLLCGRWHTSTPLLLPLRPPKCLTCPWTTLALPGGCPQLRTPTYSEVLRAPPSTKYRPSRHSIGRTSHYTFPSPLFSSKCPKRGHQRWRLLACCLTLLLPSITHQPSPTIILSVAHQPSSTIILPHFDLLTNWLPTSYSTSHYHHASITNATDNSLSLTTLNFTF